jgi:hypothetical protein
MAEFMDKHEDTKHRHEGDQGPRQGRQGRPESTQKIHVKPLQRASGGSGAARR